MLSPGVLAEFRGQTFAEQHIAARSRRAGHGIAIDTFHQGCVVRTPVVKFSLPKVSVL